MIDIVTELGGATIKSVETDGGDIVRLYIKTLSGRIYILSPRTIEGEFPYIDFVEIF